MSQHDHTPPLPFSALVREQEGALLLLRRQEGELAYQQQRIGRLQGSSDPLLLSLLPEAYATLERLLAEHAQTTRQLRELGAKLQQQIDALPSERHRLILSYRHLEHLSWREIGQLLELEPRWLMRLNRRAVEQLNGQ